MRVIESVRLTMTEGSEVEVCYRENRGVWYRAIIEFNLPTAYKSKRSRRVPFVRLLKDDDSTPLALLTRRASFRPVQPKRDRPRIGIGSIVGANHEGGWWTGTVVKEVDDDKCLVVFDSPPDILLFERKQLRPHLQWKDMNSWVILGKNIQFLRKFREEPMFSPGAMVEVRSKINISEVVWRPAMIIKETDEDDETEDGDGDEETEEEEDDEDEETEEEDDEGEEIEEEKEEEEEEEEEKRYIVKVCDSPWSYNGNKAITNKTVDARSLRPRPPPFWVEEYRSGENVEVFHGTEWRQGRVVKGRTSEFLSAEWCTVILDATKEELQVKHSDLRPLRVWDDGVWKSVESALTESSGNKMGDFVTNAEDSGPPVTPSSSITTTPLNETMAETRGNDSAQANANSEDNNRKRKREENISLVAMVEENNVTDTTMVLPFEKKLPIWKTVESMEVFKTVPQSPHFSPLAGTNKDSREVSAVGLMLTFSGLLEEVKAVGLDDPIGSLISLNDSFAELEKHGFDIKLAQLRIKKLLSLKDTKAKKMEELEDAKKDIVVKESVKVENERKILELQRLNKEAEKEIAQSKSCAATIVQHLEDVELQFQTTASAPW